MSANVENGGPVVDVRGLSRDFGPTRALDHVDLVVEPGRVLGLVGENGAGKTTLIKHLLGLLEARSGTVRVFGRDPVADPEGVLVRIGYLSEDRDLPGWMRVHELLRYLRPFYPNWDPDYAQELLDTFELDPAAKIKHLSRGQTAQVGLLAALAHRPPLLVLDEPSSGLDAVVRRDILGAIVRTVAGEGRTVLFSSHLLDEVERVADDVVMLSRGKVVLSGPLDDLKEAYRRVVFHFDEPQATPPALPGAIAMAGRGREWTAFYNGTPEALARDAAAHGAHIVEDAVPTLEEIFVARASRKGGKLA